MVEPEISGVTEPIALIKKLSAFEELQRRVVDKPCGMGLLSKEMVHTGGSTTVTVVLAKLFQVV